MKVTHVEVYQEDLDNGVQFKEVSCTDKGVFVETLTMTFDENGKMDFDYEIQKVV